MVQNITDRFSNNLIATAYPDYFVNAIDKYPYAGLVNDLAAGDDYASFYSCHPKELLKALLDLYTREFMDELANQVTLGDILTDFGLILPNGGYDTGAYILQQVPQVQLIDYLLQNYPTESAAIITYFDNAHDENFGNAVLLHALTECQFKECLKIKWVNVMGSDTSHIFDFVRYNDWISIATSVFASYPDSFTKAFAYTYPTTRVADLLEDWHYSLYAFMDGVESFYGAGMKDKIDGDTLVMTQYVRMKEFHLYGASRLGILNQNDTLKRADLHYKLSLSDPQQEPELFVTTLDYNKYEADSIYTLSVGKKLYEGSNHLGNVLVTFSDKRLGYCEDDTVYRYRADIRTANDYAAFGALLPDRQWYANNDSSAYSFGMNGQMKDDEISGVGNSYTAEYWQYDPRLGRRFNVDPIYKVNQSPYSVFANNPIAYVDLNGADTSDAVSAQNTGDYLTPDDPNQGSQAFVASPTSPSNSAEQLKWKQFDLSNADYLQQTFNLYLYVKTTYGLKQTQITDVIDFNKIKKSPYWEQSATLFNSGFQSTGNGPAVLLNYNTYSDNQFELIPDIYIINESNLSITYRTVDGVRKAVYKNKDGKPFSGTIRIVMSSMDPAKGNILNIGVNVNFDISNEQELNKFKEFNRNLGGLKVNKDW